MKDPADTLRFDPNDGLVVREPPGTGYGHWVGGKVHYDSTSEQFVLFYRERRPLEAGRAGRCAVAISVDGVNFDDVWSADKTELAANSIEEGHCVRYRDQWLLYISYEIHGTSTWRIDMMEASDPASFDAQSRRTVLSPGDFGLQWIKDPFVMVRQGELWLYAAAPPRTRSKVGGSVITAGALDATVRTTSQDGRYFPEIEYVFEAPLDDSWHGRRARINSLIDWDAEFVAFYDGGRTFYDNYEEKAGLATSPNGVEFTRVATEEPWLKSRHGIVRYVCAVPANDSVFFYYEYTREDGSHELRVSRVSL